ncbi:MAG: cytochrome D1 domain-containing protein [Pirellulaceae bacterium]
MLRRCPLLLAFLGAIAILLPSASAADIQRQLWVTNAFGDDVHVFEVGTWKLLKTIKVGPNPHGISATADGKTVHIALENFGGKEGELLWLDAATGDIKGRVKVGPKPNENECTPDGKWIYVPCEDGQYWVVDGEHKKVAAKVDTGGRPHNTTVSPDGKRMYLSPMGAPKKVTIVDVAAGHKVIGEIPFDNSVRPPAISKDEKLFFQNIDGLVGFQVADIASRKVIKTVAEKPDEDKKDVPTRSHGLCMRPDQKEVWSCNVEHESLHIHEATSGEYEEIKRLKMPGRIYWVTFTPDSKWGFVSVRSKQQVAVIDCQTKEIVKLLDAGKEPKRTQVIDVPLNSPLTP